MRLPRQSTIVSSLRGGGSTLGGGVVGVVVVGIGGGSEVVAVQFVLLGLGHLNSN